MEFTLIGFVCLAAAALVVVSPVRLGLLVLGAFIPLQTAAAINLPMIGGSSVLCAHVIAAALIGSVAIRPQQLAGALQYGARSPAVVLLGLFAVYSVTTAFFLPRIFEGAVAVYSLERAAGPIALSPLYPSSGNITQSVYLMASFLTFAVAAFIISGRGGMRRATHAISMATGVHLVFAILSVVPALPPVAAILEFVRTANYDILSHHMVVGVPRIIGSYAEPSAFGGASVGLFVWNFARFMQTRGVWHLGSSILLFLCIGMSLSTTAYAALFLVIGLWGLRSIYFIVRPGLTREHVTALLCISAGMIAIAVLFFVEPVRGFAVDAFDRLFGSKLTSDSGVERGSWNSQSFRNFVETGGLGVGLGSARASSLALALLGNVGLIGTMLYVAFLSRSFVRPWPRSRKPGADRQYQMPRRMFTAGRVAALGLVFAHLIAGTTIDAGLAYYLFAAIATAAYTVTPARKKTLQIEPVGGASELAFPVRALTFEPIRSVPTRDT